MPRLSKKYKQEMVFYLDERNRIRYNDLCKKCEKGNQSCQLERS